MASRGIGVTPPLRLPTPPEKYDVQDQREMRRLLEQAGQQLPDWTALKSTPPSISTVAAAPVATYGVSLLAGASAAATRALLGIIFHRSTQTQTTASLANLASENGTIAMPDTVADLLTIQADRPCWVRLYTDSASRTADSGRALGTLPTAGKGVLAEFVFDSSMTFPFTIPCSPVPTLANNDGTPAALVYYTIQNKSGATHTVTVTLGYGALP